jgi:hypothetical protein
LESFVRSEADYVGELRGFKEAFIDVTSKRDTEDRRRLRDDPKLAVALELFESIHDWNSALLDGLLSCKRVDGQYDIRHLVELMVRFAPGLKLYASYTTQNSECLYALDKLASVLARFLRRHPLPNDTKLEKVSLPVMAPTVPVAPRCFKHCHRADRVSPTCDSVTQRAGLTPSPHAQLLY